MKFAAKNMVVTACAPHTYIRYIYTSAASAETLKSNEIFNKAKNEKSNN